MGLRGRCRCAFTLMRYFKELLRRDNLKPPHQKGFVVHIKRRFDKKKVIPNLTLSIFINRYCNLNCYSCCALGMNPEPDETTIEEIELFLDLFKDYKPDSTILLTGGEPTMIDTAKLRRICAYIHISGHKVGMLTNGFKLHPLTWFDFVNLDNHGVNIKDVIKWRTALKESGGWYEETDKTYHQNIRYAMKDNITKGLKCTSLMKPLTLWKDVIYPCCNIMCVEWWNTTDVVTDALRRSKWTIHNPEILTTIRDWKKTLPLEFYRLCTLGCWRDADKAIWKSNERIA